MRTLIPNSRGLAYGAGIALLLSLAIPSPTRAASVIFNEIMYRPATNDWRQEYLEVYNHGTNAYNLAGWQLTSGIRFTFPPVVLGPGQYLVVAADPTTLTNLHPGLTNVVGGWEGQLGNNGQNLRLENAFGDQEDSVTYANDGDWGSRQRGPDDHGHRGWVWAAEHAGLGKSLELINPDLPGRYGQNWAASRPLGGTPGRPNSVLRTNVAPLLLEVAHSPVVPRSTNEVTVTARVLDEWPLGVSVQLFYRADGQPVFLPMPMFDDGRHGDGAPGDRVFGVVLPARPHLTVVEFYVAATDAEGRLRTWPAAVQPEGTQSANCLYQVDDTVYTGAQPLYRLITTEQERRELATIGDMPWYWTSDAQMNATFISSEAGDTKLRYLVGLRMRGTTTRSYVTKSRRVNFREDQPWQGRRAINLNAMNPHLQEIGSVLCHLAGLPATQARAVQVRENGLQLAGTNGPPYGVYAHLEALDGDFTRRQWPLDPAGNLYHPLGNANLDYLGEDPAAYYAPGFYTKSTNSGEDDWTDLIQLTRALNNSSDAEYVSEVQRAAHVDEWIRYFAVNTMTGNMESSLGVGGPGDYGLYRGKVDTRFDLLMYDQDSILGLYGGVNADLWRATNNPPIRRFLKHPEFAPHYYAELLRLTDTAFAPTNLNPVLDQFLGGYVPASALRSMKDFVVARNNYVRSQIPLKLSVRPNLAVSNYHYFTTNAVIALLGQGNAVATRGVRVGGQEATWTAWEAAWRVQNLQLLPGVNSLLVEAYGADGQVFETLPFYVWYNNGRSNLITNSVMQSTLWAAIGGPYLISGEVTVPSDVTLTIEPGASVFFEAGARLLISGRLVAEGTPGRRIRFTRPPPASHLWGGLVFTNSHADNRLVHVDMAYPGRPALSVVNSTLLVDHATWAGTSQNIIWTENSSLAVRHSVFPNLSWDQHVEGLGIAPGGHLIFEGNVFGTTVGYQDIIDFTGGHRPGPIIQVLNNVFLGGSDDGVDLDGTDAHIEGNVFMHFHKNNDSTSESSAIATGANGTETSAVTVVRNVFFDNDYDIVLKEGAVCTAQNNTFVRSVHAALCFWEPGRPWENPPRAAWLDGNIFWNEPRVMGNLDTNWLANGTVQLRVDHSILPEPGPWDGRGNLNLDPRFVNPTNDFRLQPASPALGTGPLGLDMGAYVPAGAAVSGEPPPLTWSNHVALTVGGPGIVAYQYRVNEGAYSAEFPVSQPLQLSNLANGTYTVHVLGQNSAGVWQAETNATVSRTWRVEATAGQVRLNELLALNVTAVEHAGRFPDLVELYNDGPHPVDLMGCSLSDDPANPRKYVFPPGLVLPAGGYLVLAGDSRTNEPGLHLGFGLNERGDALYLYDLPDRGGRLLDSVVFGLQLADLSLGRDSRGDWVLTQPTFGLPNRRQPLGNPQRLRINEWLTSSSVVSRDDFIELYNTDVLPVALGGLALTDEPFGATQRHIIAPLSFIAADGFRVFLADGNTDQGWDHLDFRLASEQGTLGLFTPEGDLIDIVAYGAQVPGLSQGRQPSGGVTIVSFPLPTPGTEIGTVADTRFVSLNELMANARLPGVVDSGLPDWVELYNRGGVAVDLGDCSLTDQFNTPRRWTFPRDTFIPPQGHLVIACDSSSPASATNTGFGLSAQGDALYLFDRPSGGGLLDQVVFGLQAVNFTLGRVPDGTGLWQLNLPTANRTNAATALANPSVLKINEWMASPTSGDDWLELFNPAPLPVELSGLHLTDDLNQPYLSVFEPLSFVGVGPYAYVRLIADERPTAGADHVNFRLSASGETISLLTGDGAVLEQVGFGSQQRGVSQGRMPDGSDTLAWFPISSSPGRANTSNAMPRLDPISDQTVIAGTPLHLGFSAQDANLPGQQLSFSVGNEPPAGARLEAASGQFDWTPTEAQAGRDYLLRIVVVDNGQPPLGDAQTVVIHVLSSLREIRLSSALLLGGTTFQLRWGSLPGQTYVVEFKDQVEDGAWQPEAQVTATETETAFLRPLDEVHYRFYRVRSVP